MTIFLETENPQAIADKLIYFDDKVMRYLRPGVLLSEPVAVDLDPKLTYYENHYESTFVVVLTNFTCGRCNESEGLCVDIDRFILCPSCGSFTNNFVNYDCMSDLSPGELIPPKYEKSVIRYSEMMCNLLADLKSAGEPPFNVIHNRYFVV